MTTIYDVAKKSGFSPTTVSKALNNYTDVSDKTKAKITKIAHEMGYFPNSYARTLATKKSWMIGVVFVEKSGLGITHPYYNMILESFKDSMQDKGYDLLFITKDIGKSDMSYVEHCKHRLIDGVIIVCSEYSDSEVEELVQAKIPSVILDFHSDKTNSVYSDNVLGSELAVKYLHSLGHERIAHISGNERSLAGAQRRKGYEDTMKALGLEVKDSYIADGGYYSLEEGDEAMSQLLELEDKPTAVFVSGDVMALGAIKAVREYGYEVPKDISIIGFDGLEIGELVSPTLTTIKQNTDAIGKESARLLTDSINSEDAVKYTVLPVELVKRESCSRI